MTEVLWQAARELFDQRIPQDWLPLRLLGFGVSGLTVGSPSEAHLFPQEGRAKLRALDQATDAIRKQFGRDAIRRAGGFFRPKKADN
jgi:hypothetical protein